MRFNLFHKKTWYRNLSDEQLLERWVNGDKPAGNVLLERHYQQAILFGIRFLKCRESSKDLVQDTLEKIFVKIKNQKITIKDFKAYFFAAIRQNAMNQLRQVNKREQILEQIELPPMQISEENSFEEEEIIQLAKEQLNPDQKLVLELYVQGYRNQEIAELIGKSSDQIRGLLNRAKQNIREFLNKRNNY